MWSSLEPEAASVNIVLLSRVRIDGWGISPLVLRLLAYFPPGMETGALLGTPATNCQHQCGDLGGSEGTQTPTLPRERTRSLPLLVPRGLPAPALPHPRGAACGSPGIHGDWRLFLPPPLLRCSRRAAATGSAAPRRRHRGSGPGGRDTGRGLGRAASPLRAADRLLR